MGWKERETERGSSIGGWVRSMEGGGEKGVGKEKVDREKCEHP